MYQLISLNLNGIRSATRKGLSAWLSQRGADCICVQELKAQAQDMAGGLETLADMQGYFCFAQQKGYSGVGMYCRHTPSDVLTGFGVPEFDAEGRYLELRFDTLHHKRSILSVYFPSGSSGEDRQAAKYRFMDHIYPHLLALQSQRDFVLCADINIAHQAIDLKNWRSNQQNSGFLPAERAWLTRLLADCRLVDVHRHLAPTATDEAYTWWSHRGQAYAHNVGWRLDYHLATPALAALAREVSVEKAHRFSDHAPVIVTYDF